ncbi:hypothetical protein M1M11_29265, partial [Pseudomonas azerbaijanoccidens]|uniref:hypothetical protein n=1 Tax=Pseudomonas azerbaijanoccidentalis TaxID=2842347 RepID=UPI00200A2540
MAAASIVIVQAGVMLGRGDGMDYPRGADLYPFCAGLTDRYWRRLCYEIRTHVGAAEGCDLLICFLDKIKRSQPSAA